MRGLGIVGAGSVLYTAAAIVGTTAIGQLAGKNKQLYKRVCLLHQKLFTALREHYIQSCGLVA